jgi:hypothetical protein
MGPSLLIATCLILAIRTARWPVRSDERVSDMDLEREIEHAAHLAGRVLSKTLQILSFLAWCIESGLFPDLSAVKPPFRPILIVAPLILLETETWEREMKKFFAENGDVFGNVLPLYGPMLQAYRRKDAEAREEIVARPILKLDQIQRNQRHAASSEPTQGRC